ncbi:MAG TPA: ABC transporter permease [Pirellulales bacterium]|jgi:ABC-2 type transport system permease protein|nr:ABC transporter permease [Pirellulales bacterium]
MGFVFNAAAKDLRRHLRDPLALVLWIAMPLMIGGLISLLFSGTAKGPPRPHLLVADEDGGWVGDLLTRAFAAGRAKTFLEVEEAETAEARQRMGRGEASALLIIPAGFLSDALRDRPTKLVLVTNPAQRILPQMVKEALEMVVEAVFYLHRLAGPELRALLAELPDRRESLTDEQVSQISTSINDTAQRLRKYVAPPVIELITVEDRPPAEATTVGPNQIAQRLLPGILFMALLFMAGSLSGDLWRERDQGTLRRTACTPASTTALLAGKLLASVLLIFGGSIIVLTIGMLYLKLPLARLPLSAVWSALAGATFFLLFLSIQLYATNQRAGAVLTNCVSFPLMFLGGSFFPFEAMPDWMAAVGRHTPNGWALGRLGDILFESPTAGDVASMMAIVLAICAVLFLFSERRLRRAFARS